MKINNITNHYSIAKKSHLVSKADRLSQITSEEIKFLNIYNYWTYKNKSLDELYSKSGKNHFFTTFGKEVEHILNKGGNKLEVKNFLQITQKESKSKEMMLESECILQEIYLCPFDSLGTYNSCLKISDIIPNVALPEELVCKDGFIETINTLTYLRVDSFAQIMVMNNRIDVLGSTEENSMIHQDHQMKEYLSVASKLTSLKKNQLKLVNISYKGADSVYLASIGNSKL